MWLFWDCIYNAVSASDVQPSGSVTHTAFFRFFPTQVVTKCSVLDPRDYSSSLLVVFYVWWVVCIC